MNKLHKYIFSGLILIATAFTIKAEEPNLPKVEILGTEYYYYEIGKNESVYGVAKKFDWDVEELVRLNPNTASSMVKGSRLYYPTGKVTVVTEMIEPEQSDPVYDPIEHIVKKGETVYSISRQYNIPLDIIYDANPSSKYGIKAGETILIPQDADSIAVRYLFYKVKKGDTLFSLANEYNTSIEEILKINQGVTENRLREGEVIRINVNSQPRKVKTELVDQERLASIQSYKVKKNDSWSSIADSTGVNQEQIKDANKDVETLKKDDVINIPIIETVQVEQVVEEAVPEEPIFLPIREMYDSIHGNISGTLTDVRVALILDEPSSKRDLEFSRGALLALKNLGKPDYKVSMQIIDGRSSSDNLTEQLENYEPNLIIMTAEKNFPYFIADYGDDKKIPVVNVFDVKNELYEENPSMIQLLPPSTYFNFMIADYLKDRYLDKENILILGSETDQDPMIVTLNEVYGESNCKVIEGDIKESLKITDDCIIYVAESKKDNILSALEAINEKNLENHKDITVLGKQNWITMAETNGEVFNKANVIIPSKGWVDPEDSNWKEFVAGYTEEYGTTPVKSYPNYSATGYDVAGYFIPLTANTSGDFNFSRSNPQTKAVQTEMSLQRLNNWGGFINKGAYIIYFDSFGKPKKRIVK